MGGDGDLTILVGNIREFLYFVPAVVNIIMQEQNVALEEGIVICFEQRTADGGWQMPCGDLQCGGSVERFDRGILFGVGDLPHGFVGITCRIHADGRRQCHIFRHIRMKIAFHEREIKNVNLSVTIHVSIDCRVAGKRRFPL